MSSKSTQRIAAVISLCLIFAVIGVFFSLRQLNAQGAPKGGGATGGLLPPPPGVSMMPPGGGAGGGAGSMMMPMMPGMGGGGMMGGGSQSGTPAAESAPTAPLVSIDKVVQGAKVTNVKNWDKTTITMLKFKYQLASKQVLTVYIPKELTKDKRTKDGWSALFQSFSMDKEAIVDAEIKNNPTPQSSSTSGGTTGMMGGGMMGGGMMMPGMPGGMGGGMPMLPPMR